MRLRLRPLDAGETGVVAAGDAGSCRLWSARLRWTCMGTPLDAIVLAPEPVGMPAPEPSEPPEGALARIVRACAGHGAIAILANPARALGRSRMSFAEGVRMLGIATPEDEDCWDALLALGQPAYGVRGTVVVDTTSLHPAAVISALAYGNCIACEGLEPALLDESRTGVRWDAGRDDATATVLAAGGLEAAIVAGRTGAYADRGNERTVRVVIRAGEGTCWTQPRMIAPRRDACAKP